METATIPQQPQTDENQKSETNNVNAQNRPCNFADDFTIRTYRTILGVLTEKKNALVIRNIGKLKYNQPINNINHLIVCTESIIRSECKHTIVHDYIDLDPDNGGKNITYCSKCYTCFD